MTMIPGAVLIATLLVPLLLGGCSAGHNRLQRLVTECLDLTAEDYCSTCPWPREEKGCRLTDRCTATTAVWAESPLYVAIRDRKMCTCDDASFIHGLAIPRALIPGVEAPGRPEGIWAFAWQTALTRGIPAEEVALAINPRTDRSENQMHIHIARLLPTARNRFPEEATVRNADLGAVWRLSRQRATNLGLDDYGILVTADGPGRYLAVVSPTSPEDLYLQARCRQRGEWGRH
jgi:CDP-diacylglycerol pyrophosphatase